MAQATHVTSAIGTLAIGEKATQSTKPFRQSKPKSLLLWISDHSITRSTVLFLYDLGGLHEPEAKSGGTPHVHRRLGRPDHHGARRGGAGPPLEGKAGRG